MNLAEPLQSAGRTSIRLNGCKLAYFAGCDYFRLSSHPRVLKAATRAIKQLGLNVAASRVTTGNNPVYAALEAELAHFFDSPTATLAPNGYSPNLIVAQALAGQYSHVLLDERAHASLLDAAQLLDCPVVRFRHRDPDDLARALERLGTTRPILLTDGLFAHDGSVAPLNKYLQLLPAEAMVLLDDAHGAGLLGTHGRGTPEHAGVSRKRLIQTITLSKAFGVFGGAILGPPALRHDIIERSRLFIGSTPLPPPLAAAALAAAKILRTDRQLRPRLARNANYVKNRLRAAGFPLPNNPGPVVTISFPHLTQTNLLKRSLLSARIHPPFIRYPGGPPEGAFRFVISSEHTRAQLDVLLDVLIPFAPDA